MRGIMKGKKGHKGMSQTVWLLIALVVALVVGLLLITILSGTSKKASSQGDTAITDSGAGVDSLICTNLCESCKKTYSDCAARWNSMRGDSCKNAQCQ